MTDKKILLLALLFLAGCASDPMEESGGKEAPAAAMRKIVNAPANAARGELLIYFDGDAVRGRRTDRRRCGRYAYGGDALRDSARGRHLHTTGRHFAAPRISLQSGRRRAHPRGGTA